MSNIKIALCVICKDKEKQLERMLRSTNAVFDGYFLQDTGSTDKTIEVFEQYCKENKKECKVERGRLATEEDVKDPASKKYEHGVYRYVVVDGKKILGDFGSARNDSFRMAKGAGYNYAFWIDSDDVLVGSEYIRQLAENMKVNGIAVGVMTYDYAKSNDGLKPVVQKRERLIDLDVEGEWKDRVHETYEIVPPHKTLDISGIKIEHERTAHEAVATGRRNNLIMMAQLKEDGLDNFSDKMLHNLAFDHWEHREFKKAIKYYKIFVKRMMKKPNTADILYSAYIKIGTAYLSMNNPYKAIEYMYKSSNMRKDLAEPYITLSQALAQLGRWEEAAKFAEVAIKIGKPETSAPINEYEFLITPRKILEQYYMLTGRFVEAINLANEIIRLSPQQGHKYDKIKMLEGISRHEAINGLAKLSRYIIDTNNIDMMDRVKTAIPLDLKDDSLVRGLIKELSDNYGRKGIKVRLGDKKSIVIYTGGHYEPWDGNSDSEKGIGGSEGMCIQMSRELAKLGNDVYVYNECGESNGKKIDGVTYMDWRSFDTTIRCDVLIMMRKPEMFNRIYNATKQYLWLHDTEYGQDLTVGYFYAPNKIFVLSEAHKDVIKENHGAVDNKAYWVTRNGLNRVALGYADKNVKKRDPYKFIYASSYDRGLDNVLSMWPSIRKAHPKATLDIYYGWNTYDAMAKARANTPYGQYMLEYKNKMVSQIDALKGLGVTERGRVTQNELYKAFGEASIWLYPTQFYEISCINAMTAQAMGCVPVCTPYAALNETVSSLYGVKEELSMIPDACIYLLDNQEDLDRRRKPMMEWARSKYDISVLAKEWNKFFIED